jgi:hypothetical protein
MIFGYILSDAVNVSLWRYGFGLEHIVVLAIAAYAVWLIISDMSRFEENDEPKRGGWRRRYHYKPEQSVNESNGNGTLDPPPA